MNGDWAWSGAGPAGATAAHGPGTHGAVIQAQALAVGVGPSVCLCSPGAATPGGARLDACSVWLNLAAVSCGWVTPISGYKTLLL